MKIKNVELWYPSVETERDDDQPQAVKIGLMDVRAANDILVEYDFKRDGYKISMPSKCRWEADDKVCDPCYKELAFIPAWAVGWSLHD